MSFTVKRNRPVICFFCQSTVVSPSHNRNFKCPSCGCWNRYDEQGEILSDEPAMHEGHLNPKKFASKDRLPNQYGPGPFCHSCQTNQMLLINLLSNYLPEPDSPEYESRLQMLPVYHESLYTRYPLVCDKCLPLVEDEIHRKDQMARVQALRGWLNKGKEHQRRISKDVQKKESQLDHTLFWWKVRGCLWAFSTVASLVGNACAALGHRPSKTFAFLQPVLPIFAVTSLLWAAWKPTFSSFLKAQKQSRQVRIQGKYAYNAFQMLSWICRLICSSVLSLRWFHPGHQAILRFYDSQTFFQIMFLIELISLICSALVLRIHQAPSIRLVDVHADNNVSKSRSSSPGPVSSKSMPTASTSSMISRFPAVISENDLLASLSLSSNPVITNAKANSNHHVFGLPSMGLKPKAREEPSQDEMDWAPSDPTPAPTTLSNVRRVAASLVNSSETTNWVRPQRFFAPEEPTGLERLLESARIQDEPMVVDHPGATASSERAWKLFLIHLRRWGIFYVLSVAVLIASVEYGKTMNLPHQMVL